MDTLKATVGIYFLVYMIAAAEIEIVWTPESRLQESQHVEQWGGNLARALDSPDSERMELLENGLRSMGYRKSMQDHDQKVDQLLEKIQATVVAIPGHADYFVNQIKQAKADALSSESLRGRNDKVSWAAYNRVRSQAFETMRYLPSSDTVRALGAFLIDEEDPNALDSEDEFQDTLGPGSNSGLAIKTFRYLIQDDPVKAERTWITPEDKKTWQRWYEQIKSGNRTFRFKEDPTEYDLDGPASLQKLERIAKNRQRDEKREAGENGRKTAATTAKSAENHSGKSSVAAVAFVLSSLAAAGWWWWIRKSKGQ